MLHFFFQFSKSKDVNKQSIGFTHLPGAPGPGAFFVFHSFCTKTTNKTGQHYPYILSTSMQILILSTLYCFHMNSVPNYETHLTCLFLHANYKIKHEPVPGLALFGCSSLVITGHMTTKLQSSMSA